GSEVSGLAPLAERLRERPASTLTVLRGAEMAQVDYQRPALNIDFPYLILALIGGIYLLIGLYTLLRKTDRQGFLFCLWALASAAFYLLSPVKPVDTGYVAVFLGDEIARLLLPALTLHLFLVFPTPLRRAGSDEPSPWLRRLIPFLYLPSSILFALQLQQMRAPHVSRTTMAVLDRVEMVHLAACALASVALLVYRLFRERSWEQQRQLQWMVFGLGGGYLPFLLLYGIPDIFGLRGPALLQSISVV